MKWFGVLFYSRQIDRIERLVASIQIQGEKIMSAISDYVAKQKNFNSRIVTSVQSIGDDVKALNDKIAEIQNSSGKVTPEDQALLDEAQAQGEAIATSLEALDALTPPVAPPVVEPANPIP